MIMRLTYLYITLFLSFFGSVFVGYHMDKGMQKKVGECDELNGVHIINNGFVYCLKKDYTITFEEKIWQKKTFRGGKTA